MRYFTKQNIILTLLILIGINHLVNILMPTDPPINLEREIELHDIRQERDLLQKRINQKELTIKRLEDEFHKIENDPTVDTATVHELEHFFTEYSRNR